MEDWGGAVEDRIWSLVQAVWRWTKGTEVWYKDMWSLRGRAGLSLSQQAKGQTSSQNEFGEECTDNVLWCQWRWGDIQVLWHDQIWVCVKERPWKVQLGLWVRCGSSSYVQTHTPTEDLATDCRRWYMLKFQAATTSSYWRTIMLR